MHHHLSRKTTTPCSKPLPLSFIELRGTKIRDSPSGRDNRERSMRNKSRICRSRRRNPPSTSASGCNDNYHVSFIILTQQIANVLFCDLIVFVFSFLKQCH
ncbi:hypothetical protein AAZX31_02G261800 [Glycine max]